MGKHLKILGPSLLALVAVMAVNASASQAAMWVLKEGGVEKTSITAAIKAPAGHLLVAGIDTECKNGSGGVTLSGGKTETLTGSGEIVYIGCKDVYFKTCTVRSEPPGTPKGTIIAKGSGTGFMESAKTLAKLASKVGSPFTTVVYEGAECPLTEVDGTVTGFVDVEMVNAATDTAIHAGVVQKQGLEFGEEPASIEDAAGGTKPTVELIGPGGTTTLGINLK